MTCWNLGSGWKGMDAALVLPTAMLRASYIISAPTLQRFKVLPPVVVAVPSAGTDSVALCHQFRTIDKSRLGKYVGEISAKDLTAIENGVRQVYGL
jgi:mRNA interferase MazF